MQRYTIIATATFSATVEAASEEAARAAALRAIEGVGLDHADEAPVAFGEVEIEEVVKG